MNFVLHCNLKSFKNSDTNHRLAKQRQVAERVDIAHDLAPRHRAVAQARAQDLGFTLVRLLELLIKTI